MPPCLFSQATEKRERKEKKGVKPSKDGERGEARDRERKGKEKKRGEGGRWLSNCGGDLRIRSSVRPTRGDGSALITTSRHTEKGGGSGNMMPRSGKKAIDNRHHNRQDRGLDFTFSIYEVRIGVWWRSPSVVVVVFGGRGGGRRRRPFWRQRRDATHGRRKRMRWRAKMMMASSGMTIPHLLLRVADCQRRREHQDCQRGEEEEF